MNFKQQQQEGQNSLNSPKAVIKKGTELQLDCRKIKVTEEENKK